MELANIHLKPTTSLAPVAADSLCQTLFYQCKFCSSFLTSMSKGECHLQRCLQRTGTSTSIDLKSNCISNQLCSKNFTPVLGLREISFTQPKLMLERITQEESKIFQKSDCDEGSKRKSTRIRKFKTNSWANLMNDEKSSKDEEDADAEWREDLEANPKNSTSRRKAKKNGNANEHSKEKVNPKWLCSRNEDGSQKRVRNRLYLREKVDVRSFRFPCHLCPAKFYLQQELDTHVNGIHYGDRKLISCCICGKIFNKRDSLNQHIRGHETAEFYRLKYDLLQPWSEERLKDLYVSKPGPSRQVTFLQPKCYFCLLPHSSYHSYITHIREEHCDSPEAFLFACTFQECSEKFSSIKTLLDHAKSIHPLQFFGKLTWNRMNNGIFTGKKVQNATPNETKMGKHIKNSTPRQKPSKTTKKSKRSSSPPTRCKKSVSRKKDPFSDPNDHEWSCKNKRLIATKSTGWNEDSTLHERKIKLEAIQIAALNNEIVDDNPYIKIEPTDVDVLEEMYTFPVAEAELLPPSNNHSSPDEEYSALIMFDHSLNPDIDENTSNYNDHHNTAVFPSPASVKIEKDLLCSTLSDIL